MKSIRRNRMKTFFLSGLITLSLLAGPALVDSKDYPTREVMIYTGMAPGAAAGISSTVVAEGLKKIFGKPFIVNYKVGAGGMIAVDYFMKQPADGYHLQWIDHVVPSNLAFYPHKYSFTKEDFIFIGTIGASPYVMAVNKKSPYKMFEDFVDYAKKNPEELSYGYPATLSIVLHEKVLSKVGIKLVRVPFEGGAKVVTALLGGHITCYMGSVATFGAHIKPEGGLRVLAVLGSKRLPDFPEVPTCLEKGYDVGEMGTWQMVVAKKGTPKPIIDPLVEAFKKVANDPEVKTTLTKAGFIPLEWGPDESEKLFNRDFYEFREFFQKLGLK